MKRTTIHISAALALLLGLAACTQDEAGFLPEGAEGTPIVFTVTGLNPTATATADTRAPVDGNWEGVQTVAVAIGGEVKAYDVTPTTADNTSATLTSDEPYYWTNHNNITVTAWWPYTEGETTPPAVVVKADQSARKDFEGSDLIVAEEQTVSYGNPTLRFTHRTARVTVILTDYTEGLKSVSLTGLSTENGNPAVIAPHDKGGDTYTALVAPQTVAAGTAFITCKFTNGKVFVYKMKNDTDWQAGKEYTYTVSLAAAEDPGYTVSEDGKTYTVTSADGLKNVAKLVNEEGKTDINITLDTDLTLTGEWTPIGTESQPYTGTFNGKDKTITGLTVNQKVTDYVGLIGYLGTGGKVQNVTLTDVSVTGNWYVGGVVGYNSSGSVTACTSSGSVSGSSYYVGGVVGYNSSGSVTACTSSGSVSGSFNVGGVMGYNYGTVTACYATGSVTGSGSGTIYVGGVTGSNNLGILTACYHAKGDVSGPTGTTGGVAGRNFKGSMSGGGIITACFWGSNGQTQGIGEDQVGTGGTTMVTDGNWQNAVTQMNAALQSAGSEWRYELTGALPTLKK